MIYGTLSKDILPTPRVSQSLFVRGGNHEAQAKRLEALIQSRTTAHCWWDDGDCGVSGMTFDGRRYGNPERHQGLWPLEAKEALARIATGAREWEDKCGHLEPLRKSHPAEPGLSHEEAIRIIEGLAG